MLSLICLSLFAVAAGIPLKECSIACYDLWAPVCGTDGNTYSNDCALNSASCLSKAKGLSAITIAHNGQCPRDEVDDVSYCYHYCDEERSPVCASDGLVYDNQCKYQVAQCIAAQNGTRLSIISYTSFCPTPTQASCEQYSYNTSDLALEYPTTDQVQIMCSTGGHEICTNHGTFNNECAVCKRIEQDLAKQLKYPGYHATEYHILYEGPCASYSHVVG